MNIKRHHQNPLIKPSDMIPSYEFMEVIGTFNCGVTEYQDEIYILIRVAEKCKTAFETVGVPMYLENLKRVDILCFDRHDPLIDLSDPRFVKTQEGLYLTSMSHLRLAKSKDGIHFDIIQQPWLEPDNYYEEFGIEDARITLIEDTYYINYSAVSRSGVVTCLAKTKDFINVERCGVIFLPDNKDVAIFPKKINGKYYALNRPVSAYFKKPEIWIASSDDLLCFSNHRILCSLRKDHFDSARIGASCVPYLTSKGWLEIYHGADEYDKYCVGVLLLDKNDPTKIIYRSDIALIEPMMPYEKDGFMPNVIFPCGFIVKDDQVFLYYGACDETVCLITFSLNELLYSIDV